MRHRRVFPVLATAAALILTGCGSVSGGDTQPAGNAADDTGPFPVTIEHVYGETVIDQAPERVAAVAWANADAALALGVVPVGMAAQSYGDDDGDGVHTWTEDRLDELGAETPELYDETDGLDFEAIAGSRPDLILATFSGITEEEYETLSKIAPTVAYPDLAWGTPWQEVVEITGRALGREDDAETLLADVDEQIDAALAEHPEIAGKSAMWSWIDPTDLSTLTYYTDTDARAVFLTDLGMTVPSSIAGLSAESDGAFFGQQSAENIDVFDDVDILFTYGDDALLEQAQTDPLLGTIPAIQRGSVVLLPEGSPLAAAVSPPTALSVTWSLDAYVDLIAAAASSVQ